MRKTERIAVEIMMIATILFIAGYILAQPKTEMQYTQHTVRAGETVWCIAEKYADMQVRPMNEFVYGIQSENHLAGKYIRPGDVLVIPMAVPEKKGGGKL